MLLCLEFWAGFRARKCNHLEKDFDQGSRSSPLMRYQSLLILTELLSLSLSSSYRRNNSFVGRDVSLREPLFFLLFSFHFLIATTSMRCGLFISVGKLVESLGGIEIFLRLNRFRGSAFETKQVREVDNETGRGSRFPFNDISTISSDGCRFEEAIFSIFVFSRQISTKVDPTIIDIGREINRIDREIFFPFDFSRSNIWSRGGWNTFYYGFFKRSVRLSYSMREQINLEIFFTFILHLSKAAALLLSFDCLRTIGGGRSFSKWRESWRPRGVYRW